MLKQLRMLKPIKNKFQHEQYLARSDELELLSILIEAYEKENYPIEPPHPIEAILFRIDQMGMKKSELKKVLGSRSRVSEVLSGKRKLSLSMIRKLNKELGISAQTLITDYEPMNG